MTAAPILSEGHSASDAVSPGRIPAWKKLGLKLKFAKEHTDQHAQHDNGNPIDKKRPRDEGSQKLPEAPDSGHGVKKRPRIELPNNQLTKSISTNGKTLSPSLRRDSNGTRKTVSFSLDTKVEDGDSSKSLIADWEAQYDQTSFSLNDFPKDPEPLKTESSKSRKSRPLPPTKKPHAALEYLRRFCQSKETWKFSKNREIWILKHLFSVNEIPSDYDVSLSQYLQGLKSTSARSRIRQEAEEVVRKDCEQRLEYIVSSEGEEGVSKVEAGPADMEDPERRRAYYEDSVRRYKRKLEQHLDEVADEELNWVSPERLAKRRRAEITLWAIGVTPSTAGATQSSDATISGQSASRNGSIALENGPQKKKSQKKRKTRTSIIELSSSSGSSEDESSNFSSESDSDGEGDGEGDDEGSDNGSSSTRTSARTLSSISSQTHGESSSDEDTESSSSSSGSSDASDSDQVDAAVTNGRPRSTISTSS